MASVEVVAATSSTDCCSCSVADCSDAGEGCNSLWKLLCFCRRKHRAGELHTRGSLRQILFSVSI